MASHENDATTDVLSPRQITEVLITLLSHAVHHKLNALEANLENSLEALMQDINRTEREVPPSQPNCESNIVDFDDARRRLLCAARDEAQVGKTGPTRTKGA